jgi:hypothetical protein
MPDVGWLLCINCQCAFSTEVIGSSIATVTNNSPSEAGMRHTAHTTPSPRSQCKTTPVPKCCRTSPSRKDLHMSFGFVSKSQVLQRSSTVLKAKDALRSHVPKSRIINSHYLATSFHSSIMLFIISDDFLPSINQSKAANILINVSIK